MKGYGEPWKVIYCDDGSGDVEKIVDRDDNTIVETDNGYYGPTAKQAERIVQCVNERAGKG